MVAPYTINPHVAFLPSPGMGHITPLFELAKRLAIHHNFNVTFLVITTTEPSAAQNQLLHSPSLPSSLHVIELPPVDPSLFVTDQMPVLTQLCLIVKESLCHLKSVLLNLDDVPKALVIDLFCTQAFDVCSEISIPVYSFFTASTYLLVFSLYLPFLDREVEGEFIDLVEPIQIPGCKPLRIEDLLDQVCNRKIEEYKWYLFHVSRLVMAKGIFVNSWEELEPVTLPAIRENSYYKEINTPQVHPVGPLIKMDEPVSDSDAECLAWLDEQPLESVLFVALGSGGTLSTSQLTELAMGLELSQQRFIFVVRKPSDCVTSTFFNVGSDINDPKSHLPNGFLERTKKYGLVVSSWAPQVAVLSHPSTGGFLSHCGWNSSLESIVHGVPIIAWPLYAEQRMNATILAEDIGVAIKPMAECNSGIIEREEIERVVRLIMEGEEGKAMRHKAKELKYSGIETLKVGGASHESLARVVETWRIE